MTIEKGSNCMTLKRIILAFILFVPLEVFSNSFPESISCVLSGTKHFSIDENLKVADREFEKDSVLTSNFVLMEPHEDNALYTNISRYKSSTGRGDKSSYFVTFSGNMLKLVQMKTDGATEYLSLKTGVLYSSVNAWQYNGGVLSAYALIYKCRF